MNTKLVTGLGLLRDVVAAGLALAILFGWNLSDDQVAGVLLLVTTLGAFGTWAFGAYFAKASAAGTVLLLLLLVL